MRDVKTITVSETGASEPLDLPDGLWSLAVSSSEWGEAALQHSDAAGQVWDATRPSEEGDPVVLTEDRVLAVRGGFQYRLSASEVVQPITVTARRLRPGAL